MKMSFSKKKNIYIAFDIELIKYNIWFSNQKRKRKQMTWIEVKSYEHNELKIQFHCKPCSFAHKEENN